MEYILFRCEISTNVNINNSKLRERFVMYLLFKIFVLFKGFILQKSIDPRYVPNISKRKNGSEIK